MSSNSDPERIVADRYVLRRELGRGGMGVVWEAFDPSLDRVVAVKQVLLPDHFTDSERADAHGRVRREARSAARISHPAVITVHDVFEYGGNPWVVMELIEGGSLQERLDERGALPVDAVAEIGEALVKAVRAANAAGVLHRDIKPGNIMMSLDGRVVLTDFGIATMEGGPSITRTGALIGSPEYMPPERLEGAPADHRGDLWSIGVTLLAAVEGVSPFHRDSLTAAIAAVISAPLPPMTHAGWLKPVITGLLERDPDRRLTADEALALLRERGGPGGGAAVFGSGPQSAHHAPSGGHTAFGGPPGGHPGTGAPPPQSPPPGHMGPTGPGRALGTSGPNGPANPAAPFPSGPGHRPAPSYQQQPMYAGGYGGPGGPGGPHAGGPGHGPLPAGANAQSGSGTTRVLLGVGAGAVALLLIATVVAVVLLRSGGEPANVSATPVDPPASQAPPTESSDGEEADAGSGYGGESGESGDGGQEGDDGEPPSYDELETFSSEWFTVDYPAGWEVDDSQIDNTLAVFVAPGGDHQVWVTGWTEEEFTGTSAEYLRETKGGTDVSGDVTTGFTQLELKDFDEDDFEEGWDVALVEADLANETWATPERRFWAYAVNMDYEGNRVFYLVSVNVPRGQADHYDDLHEDVMETFTPHL
ncbi:putative Ser/Thr protein kinase [Nocardiopsis arvandica]|uniref:non-specific serine/threonine protein kinase n=1 Tax=Nocardiopsis sinuspersici TaxID=501010 RepID=A0A7Y9XD67_9ACTN|nr:serine/threonine-protein kinase [Nocardiopsis sinuspersici]NYH53558.1 putative Ser/Thr protein kinase [Nocardiopsis sinuspersici]